MRPRLETCSGLTDQPDVPSPLASLIKAGVSAERSGSRPVKVESEKLSRDEGYLGFGAGLPGLLHDLDMGRGSELKAAFTLDHIFICRASQVAQQ